MNKKKEKRKKRAVLLILDTMLAARDRNINSNFIAKVHTKLATLVKTISRVSHFYFLEVLGFVWIELILLKLKTYC